jgi:hypothetical protein
VRRIAFAFPDPSRGADRTALRRQDAERDLRQTPFGALRCDDKVAAKRQDASDADRVSIDRGDYRLREFVQHRDGAHPAALGKVIEKIGDRIFGVGARILEVGARAEGAALFVAGQDDASHVAILLQFREALAESGEKFRAPCVARLGTAQSQRRDVAEFFTNQRHCVSSRSK